MVAKLRDALPTQPLASCHHDTTGVNPEKDQRAIEKHTKKTRRQLLPSVFYFWCTTVVAAPVDVPTSWPLMLCVLYRLLGGIAPSTGGTVR